MTVTKVAFSCARCHGSMCLWDAGVTGQMLQRSGYDRDEQADIAEQLHQLANGPHEEDDESD